MSKLGLSLETGRFADVDEQPEIAEAYGIPGIPTLVLFRNGQRVDEKHGPLPKERLSRWLEQALA